jgi:hypothetical protein
MPGHHLRDGRESVSPPRPGRNSGMGIFFGGARRTPHIHSPVNVGACLTMICEVCNTRQATIHGMLTDTENGAAKRLRHFCMDCFETSNGLDITRLEEDLENDLGTSQTQG